MGRIFALRHCQTLYNTNGIISGQANIHICSTFIDLHEYQNVGKSIIITSPLIRCLETCELLRSRIEVSQLIVDSRLSERHMGIFQGINRRECQLKYPEYFKNDGRFNRIMSPPQGESFSSFYNRIKEFYDDIRHKDYDSLIIVSHNQTLKLLQEIMNCNSSSLGFINGVLVELSAEN